MLGHIDKTRMPRKFKVNVRPFPGAKTEDMFHYFVPLLEKMPDSRLRYTSCCYK